jgi:hypothetical protein
MDETRRFGALVSEAIRRNLPVSFLATGQQIPEHLEPASRQTLAALVLEEEPSQANISLAPREPDHSPMKFEPLKYRTAKHETVRFAPLKFKAAGAGA